MKKALSVFLIAALALGAVADEPVADVNVAEFTGWAKVEWGVDLDSGTTGFKNTSRVDLKLNILNNGTRSTAGDGVWGELVLKVDGDEYIQWRNDNYESSDSAFAPDEGMSSSSSSHFLRKVYVDVAKIHIGPAYIGIKTGDTQTGQLKMDAAIRSADDDQGLWLDNQGPASYSQGIVLGFDSDLFKVDLDLRSRLASGKTVYTSSEYPYTDDYAAALEAEIKAVENLSVKLGASYDFAENYQAKTADSNKTADSGNQHALGYSASAGYKLGLDDTFFIRPQVGFAGSTGFKESGATETVTTSMEMAAGLLFGWGEIGMDQNAGVYYLDDDMAKKVSPGVGVVAHIPLPTTITTTDADGKESKKTLYFPAAARIMPSFYSGELIPGLTAAAYADILVPKTGKTDGDEIYKAGGEDRATPVAFTLGAKYAIGVNEVTVTPQAAVRFANAAYVDYKVPEVRDGDDNPVFGSMGDQKKKSSKDSQSITSDGNYLNLKIGVDVAGLIDNTTLSVVWSTTNILNKEDDSNKNISKFGTLNFGAKIAL